MGREVETITCKTKDDATDLLKAYTTITRIRKFPIYKGYVIENTVYLEIVD